VLPGGPCAAICVCAAHGRREHAAVARNLDAADAAAARVAAATLGAAGGEAAKRCCERGGVDGDGCRGVIVRRGRHGEGGMLARKVQARLLRRGWGEAGAGRFLRSARDRFEMVTKLLLSDPRAWLDHAYEHDRSVRAPASSMYQRRTRI